MIDVLPLTVGPITGHTTTNSIRIFGRGAFKAADIGYERCHGVARIREKSADSFGDVRIFKMNPNFDFSGVIEFDELLVDTIYDYEIGYFFDEREPGEINVQKKLRWKTASSGSVKTAVDNNHTIT